MPVVKKIVASAANAPTSLTKVYEPTDVDASAKYADEVLLSVFNGDAAERTLTVALSKAGAAGVTLGSWPLPLSGGRVQHLYIGPLGPNDELQISVPSATAVAYNVQAEVVT